MSIKSFKGKIRWSLKNEFLKALGQGDIENFEKFWTLGTWWLSQSQNFEVINSKNIIFELIKRELNDKFVFPQIYNFDSPD